MELRPLAVRCCRRLLERFPDDWPSKVFLADDGHPGGYVSPNDWPGGLLVEAVRAAEAIDGTGRGVEYLCSVHERAKVIAEDCEHAWRWADAKLGDSATGAEYEVGFVAWQVASAARDCCSEDIRSSVADCIQHTIAALGFRWGQVEHAAAFQAECKAMTEVVRNLL